MNHTYWSSRFVIGVSLLLLGANAVAAEKPKYTYYTYLGSPMTPGNSMVIAPPAAPDRTGWIAYGSDELTEAIFCPSQSDFICFKSATLAFAYPKHRPPELRTWTVDGVTFELVAEGLTVTLLGRTYRDLVVVKQPKGSTPGTTPFPPEHTYPYLGAEVFYLYSPAIGIVAIEQRSKMRPDIDKTALLWLSDKKGFGVLGR